MAPPRKPTKASKEAPLKLNYFGYDLAAIRKYWKSRKIYEDARTYLHLCLRSIQVADEATLRKAYEKNTEQFRNSCQGSANRRMDQSYWNALMPPPVPVEQDVKIVLCEEIQQDLDDLEEARALHKVKRLYMRKLNWKGNLGHLRRLLEYLVRSGYLEPYDFETIDEIFVVKGREIARKSYDSGTNKLDPDDTFSSQIATIDGILKSMASKEAE